MSNLVNIKLHGVLSKQLGRSEWKLNVKSVGEAIRGIESNTKKLYKQLMENDKKSIKYRVVINDNDFLMEDGKDPDSLEDLANSELAIKRSTLKKIDIVPVIEGSDDIMSIFTIVLGVALIFAGGVGLGLFGAPAWSSGAFAAMGAGGWSAAFSGALMLGGIGLVASGVSNLLTPMPQFGDFREIEGGGNRSYLFNGPENTVREGGPVFVGYGRLLIGSHVIQSASDTVDYEAEVKPKDTWGETKYGLLYNIPNAAGLLKTATDNWNKDE